MGANITVNCNHRRAGRKPQSFRVWHAGEWSEYFPSSCGCANYVNYDGQDALSLLLVGQGRLIGYERVSTDAQDTALQHAALLAAGCELIFEEKLSSVAKDRHALQACLRVLQDGDTLAVWKVDRLGRSMLETATIVDQLNKRGVGFKSLTQPVDTTNPMGKMMLQMLMMFAEFERSMIVERTEAGLKAAAAKGHFGGRRRSLAGDKFERAKQAYFNRPLSLKTGRPMTTRELAESLGVAPRTLQMWVLHDGEQTSAIGRAKSAKAHPDREAWLQASNDPNWGRNLDKRAR